MASIATIYASSELFCLNQIYMYIEAVTDIMSSLRDASDQRSDTIYRHEGRIPVRFVFVKWIFVCPSLIGIIAFI